MFDDKGWALLYFCAYFVGCIRDGVAAAQRLVATFSLDESTSLNEGSVIKS